jgi:hypothetical protein
LLKVAPQIAESQFDADEHNSNFSMSSDCAALLSVRHMDPNRGLKFGKVPNRSPREVNNFGGGL